MGKMSREEAEKMLGKRTPLPGAGEKAGPNWEKKKEEYRPTSGGSLGDPLGLKKTLKDREKGYTAGGKVRGCGIAKRGKNFSGMY